MTVKLETELEKVEINQTRNKPDPIRFRDESINKIKKELINFGGKTARGGIIRPLLWIDRKRRLMSKLLSY